MRVDVHQHLWTAPLVEALERRRRLPYVRREDDGRCTVYLAGEPPSAVLLAGEQPAIRRELLEHDGLDRALIAISSPLGIEALPREESQTLLDAHLDGVEQLGESFGAWGPLALDGLCAADIDPLLARGCVGVSLPAGACAPPSALDALYPVLAALEEREIPLFVHPGPGRDTRAPEVGLDDPLWWPALTRYVAQMQAAWLAFHVIARRAHPRLRVVFAMLAGGAPLLSERIAARGGSASDAAAPLSFYDTSSYGPFAIEAMARRTGLESLLHGSDRPVAEPTAHGRDALLRENGAWLLARSGVTA